MDAITIAEFDHGGFKDKAQATAKDIEGKSSRAFWQATDSGANQLAGKGETASSPREHAVEDAKGPKLPGGAT